MAAKKGRNPFVWIILILLFVGLLGFGTGGLGGNVRSLGKAGNKDIAVAAYRSGLDQQLRTFEAQTGQRITFQQARDIGLDQAVLQQLIANRTLDNEVTNLGISVGDERVRREVLRVPAFQDLSGDFNRAAYSSALSRVGQTEAEFEASIREEIARTMLQGAVVNGIPAPEAYADTVIQFIAETRDVTFATVTDELLDAPVPGPTEADLQAYYDANPDAYTAPEAREITYVWITPDQLRDDITVPEEELRALYDERIDDFVQPERRLVERLVYVSTEAAEAAAAQIASGETDFEALVTDRGLSLSDIDLGDVTRDSLGSAADAAFAAEPGDVVGPFNTPLGPALFRVNAILNAEETTFEDARADLSAELATARAAAMISGIRETINDLMAGGATLEDLADETDLTLGTLSLTDETTDGPAAYDAFRNAAMSVTKDAFPSLESLADGGIFALRLDEITPPTLRPLDDVRDAVAADWTRERTQADIMVKAQELADQISPLTGFESLGLTPTEADRITRTTFVEGTPPAFLTEVFTLEPGEVRVIESGDNALIIRLDRIAAPDLTDEQVAAQLEVAGQTAAQGIAQDIFSAFNAAVQTRTDVRIDQTVVDAVNAQFQ